MLISVIVPIYNCEKYLDKCLNSILNQSYKKIEVILVNDGSTDNSKLICESFVKKDSRVKLFNRENKGAAASRNFGLKNCSGDIISFIDADDYISNNMYEEMINQLINENLDILICGNKNNIYDSNHILKMFLAGHITPSVCDKIYKRKCFMKFDIFPEGKIAEDHKVVYDLIKSSYKIGFINKNYYFYRSDNLNSVTKKTLNNSIVDVFEIKEFIINDIKNNNPYIGKKYFDLYLIPTSIYTKGRLVTENNNLSKKNIDKINKYYKKYKYKSIFTPKVNIKIKLISILLIFGVYGLFKKIKKYLIKRKL